MTPKFPNSAFVRAPERFVLAGGRWSLIDIPIRYGVFNHPIGGRCLIDTGYSDRTLKGKRSLALKLYAAALRPKLTVEALPFAAPGIDTIILTHLHADHISALRDYPSARILADGNAVEHFMSASRISGVRHGFFKEMIPSDFKDRLTPFGDLRQVEAPFELGPARDVFGDGAVLAVPLPGHMKGHTGIVWPREDPPLLYAADAEWLREAIISDRSPGPPARFVLDNKEQARRSAARIRRFMELGGNVVFCHDPDPLS